MFPEKKINMYEVRSVGLKKGDNYIPHKRFIGYIIPNSLSEVTNLSHGAKMCFGRLCQYAGKNGKCFPSYEALGKELGVSKRTSIRRVNELVDYGLIKIKHNTGDTNNFIFTWHEIFDDDLADNGI